MEALEVLHFRELYRVRWNVQSCLWLVACCSMFDVRMFNVRNKKTADIEAKRNVIEAVEVLPPVGGLEGEAEGMANKASFG